MEIRNRFHHKVQGASRFSVFTFPLSCVLVVCLLLFVCVHASWAVVYVDQTSSDGDGSSWNFAYRTIESAIAGSGENQEFWIAQGPYTPVATLKPKLGSALYGGFAGNENDRSQRDPDAHPVIIDGRNVLYHVFYLAGSTNGENVRLDGFTIKRGAAKGSSSTEKVGGGVMAIRLNAVINNCTFQGNSAQAGGAIYGWESNVTITDCLFADNRTDYGPVDKQRGGAVWIHLGNQLIHGSVFSNNFAGRQGGAIELNNTPGALISDCSFTGNKAPEAGGAVSLLWDRSSPLPSVVIEDSSFENNQCGVGEGGGVYSFYFPVIVKGCTFIGNRAANGGGVMLDYDMGQEGRIEGCLFLNNSATMVGGAIRSYEMSTTVVNSVFAYNVATHAGAAGFHAGAADNYRVHVANSVFYDNEAEEFGGAIKNTEVPMMYLYNSILWGNNAVNGYHGGQPSNDISNIGSSSMTTRYTDMETLTWPHGSISEDHTGSFSQNPLFVDPDGVDNIKGTLDDNFRLSPASPCIDRGDGDYSTALDLQHHVRVDSPLATNSGTGTPGYTDIGAYEYGSYGLPADNKPVGFALPSVLGLLLNSD